MFGVGDFERPALLDTTSLQQTLATSLFPVLLARPSLGRDEAKSIVCVGERALRGKAFMRSSHVEGVRAEVRVWRRRRTEMNTKSFSLLACQVADPEDEEQEKKHTPSNRTSDEPEFPPLPYRPKRRRMFVRTRCSERREEKTDVELPPWVLL